MTFKCKRYLKCTKRNMNPHISHLSQIINFLINNLGTSEEEEDKLDIKQHKGNSEPFIRLSNIHKPDATRQMWSEEKTNQSYF